MTRAPDPRARDDDWSRYARHLAGEHAADEAERARRWIAEDPRRAREADEARSTWQAAAPAADLAAARRAAVAADADAAWARLAARLGDAAPVAPPRRASVRARQVAVAAGLAVAASAAVVVVPQLRAALGLPGAGPAWTTYAAAAGQRASVYLPDGSRAELRPGTTLRVAVAPRGAVGALLRRLPGAAPAPRVAELAGEAIFTVVHDAARPFRVYAGGAVTEDLGTRFAVRAYAGEPTVRVVVTEGAVSVARRAAAATGGATLAPGDVATLDAAGALTLARSDDPDAYLAWSRDRLVFRHERLAAVVADLSRAYDARVAVGDSALAERRVTLDMPAGTLDAALATLAALLDVEQRRTADGVVLRPAHPAPH
jgi:transmembrane sensor